MTTQEELLKSAELLLELGFSKEASAVSAAIDKINRGWLAEELLAEEAQVNVQLRDLVHELRGALLQQQQKNRLPVDTSIKGSVYTAFDDGIAAALGSGAVAHGLAQGAVAVSTGKKGSAKVQAKNGVAVVSSEGATAQSTATAGGTAIATGTNSSAFANGSAGVAIASGENGEVSGSDGAALVLVERSSSGKVLHTWCGVVGRGGILPYTAYRLRDGKLTGEIFD
ncbi:flagellar hook-length control protein [Xanthomonas phage vB_XooS_NR08]|nr:flagellar hook-length control protein [Xanthomonas phage vB_XooS_NR08]